MSQNNSAFTPSLKISPATTVRKRRELPISGEVLVKVGDRVSSDTIIAEALREGELRIVRAAEALSITPAEVVRRIKLSVGDPIEEGATLIELRGLWGLFKSVVAAPIGGVIEFVSPVTGHIGIRAPATKLSVRGYISGTVDRVDNGRAAEVVAEASFIQGIFGVGGEKTGVIRLLDVTPGDPVCEHHIPNECRGSILVGGCSPSLAALNLARQRGAVGFVTGSIDDLTLAEYVGYDIGVAVTGDEPLSMSVIVTEGFGSLPINLAIISILKEIEGSEASINGATQVRAGALRPEIISRVSSALGFTGAAAAGGGLSVGGRVRIIRVPYFGAYGVVVELPHEPQRIESGAFTRVARVRLDQSRAGLGEVVVPRANLELVGV
jgi:hypothetical protein